MPFDKELTVEGVVPNLLHVSPIRNLDCASSPTQLFFLSIPTIMLSICIDEGDHIGAHAILDDVVANLLHCEESRYALAVSFILVKIKANSSSWWNFFVSP